MKFFSTNDMTKIQEFKAFIRTAAELAGMQVDEYRVTPKRYTSQMPPVISSVVLVSDAHNVEVSLGEHSYILHPEGRVRMYKSLNDFDMKTAKNLANQIRQYMARGEKIKYR